LKNQYTGEYGKALYALTFADPVESEHLFSLLDGLPLAIAQAGAFLRESGVGIGTYIQFYEQQCKELMEPKDETEDETYAPLQDYPGRSVWTTWAISYNAVREKDEATATFLLLWSFLDNKNLWHGLFSAACKASATTARRLSEWIGDMASNELKFAQAMQLLQNYSLLEEVENLASYATHPVVHKWARDYQGQKYGREIARLAVEVVGFAVPGGSRREYSTLQRRLLPHAQACSQLVAVDELWRSIHSHDGCESDSDRTGEKEVLLSAANNLGTLYEEQGKLGEAERMYGRALRGYGEVLGPKHKLMLAIIGNLGNLYSGQDKLGEAEKVYVRALQGY
jgi:tetratricopeptide (TPR) repeat protein